MVDRVKVLLFGIYLMWTVFATLRMRQGEHSRCPIMIVSNGLFVCKQGIYDQLLCVTRYFDNLLRQFCLYTYNLTIKTLHNVIECPLVRDIDIIHYSPEIVYGVC